MVLALVSKIAINFEATSQAKKKMIKQGAVGSIFTFVIGASNEYPMIVVLIAMKNFAKNINASLRPSTNANLAAFFNINRKL
jgi:ethanolamine utilization protein EutA (predicted chaperonin)